MEVHNTKSAAVIIPRKDSFRSVHRRIAVIHTQHQLAVQHPAPWAATAPSTANAPTETANLPDRTPIARVPRTQNASASAAPQRASARKNRATAIESTILRAMSKSVL